MTLDEVPTGHRATITRVTTGAGVTLRLMELGMVPGRALRVLKRAPFGGPMQLEFPGFRLSVRAGEARAFEVEA
ncbi:MAG: ferrous iron transport protein A [Myxococcota bacterium]